MSRRNWWQSALSAALAAIFVCTLSLHAAPGHAQARTHAANGGTLIIDFQTDISHLDTGKCYDVECWPFMHVMYDRLIDYDTLHAPGTNLIPEAAVAMPTLSKGGLTYTFKLRHDVRFWNGRLVTSADWIYSFERIINPATQAGAASFWLNIVGAREYAAHKAGHVSGIKALGKWGLQITLISPDASFLNVLAMPFGSVVDKNQIARYGKLYDAYHPMGTGPYMFKEHQLGQRLILVRNPHYYKPGVGHLDRIEADFGVDTTTGFLRIKRGQADLDGDLPSIPAPEFLNVLHDPKWSKQVFRLVQVATWYVAMNTLMKPFDNVLVRRAVNMAINKPLIVRLIQGRGVVADTFLPPTMPGYAPYKLYAYDPTKARQIMAQAGYGSGVSTMFYTDNVADDPRISQAIIPMLANIGIKATLRVVNGNTLQTLVGTKKKVPIVWTGWFEDFPDPNDFFEPILSCASAVPGTFNEPWYCNPKVDAFAHKLKSMTDRAARLRLYPQLDKMVMRDAPVVPVYHSVYYDIHSFALHNYSYNNVWEYDFARYTKS
ncbi:MAG TPA: ABC transporter substrate-binding protein [Chloroflexota bacterium]|nr:ABC transporter substrate-binding protein [Chloroflexota bacterium]